MISHLYLGDYALNSYIDRYDSNYSKVTCFIKET